MKRFLELRFFMIMILFFLALSLLSFKEDTRKPQPDKSQYSVELSLRRSIQVLNGGEILVLPFNPGHSVAGTAKSEGRARAFIVSPGGKVPDSSLMDAYTLPGNDSILKVLAIGNSFSEDAVEHYLYGLAVAAGHKIVIGDLVIGGAKLGLHWKEAKENKADYFYRKISEGGTKTTTTHTTISTVLKDEDWDYISFQQASIYSGRYNTFVIPLSNLYAYVKERTKNPDVKYVLHQTWAYAEYSDHKGYDTYYDSDQMTMYRAIVDAYKRAKKLINADLIIPSGTAIQNGRTSVIGDHFNRDGHHLNILGRYTASCTWFEALFGESVIGNTYAPDELSEEEVKIAQYAAHMAVKFPAKVTEIKDFTGMSTTLKKRFAAVGRDASDK